MYQLAHYIIKHFPFLWDIVEFFNEKLFCVRYGTRLKHINGCLEKYQKEYSIKEATMDDLTPLVVFFDKQPPESFEFFQPHGFDDKSLKRLIKRKSYLIYIVKNGDDIIGYVFLRCFFMGKCYRGKMVDINWRGKGIAVLMGRVATDITSALGLRMFGTISKANTASMFSSKASNDIRIVKELPNNYLYIEYLPKKQL